MQKKNCFYLILFTLVNCALYNSVVADDYKFGANIAVINTEQILENSAAIKTIRDSMQQMSSQIENDLTQKEIELKRMEYELLQQRESLNEEEYQKQLTIFNDRVSETQKLVHTRKHALEETHRASRQKVYNKILEIIQTLSEKYKFDVVLPFSQLVFARDNLDITAEVLDQLNKEQINFKIEY